MKQFEWDEDKNKTLKRDRNISFEDIEEAIATGGLLDIVPHHNQKQYPHQKKFIVHAKSYIYEIPFIDNPQMIFLKTIIPSRKAKKKYIDNI